MAKRSAELLDQLSNELRREAARQIHAETVDLLTACREQITILQEKLARGEGEGWEGSKYRCVLRRRLDDLITKSRGETQ